MILAYVKLFCWQGLACGRLCVLGASRAMLGSNARGVWPKDGRFGLYCVERPRMRAARALYMRYAISPGAGGPPYLAPPPPHFPHLAPPHLTSLACIL
jgi:hypothetical protein